MIICAHGKDCHFPRKRNSFGRQTFGFCRRPLVFPVFAAAATHSHMCQPLTLSVPPRALCSQVCSHTTCPTTTSTTFTMDPFATWPELHHHRWQCFWGQQRCLFVSNEQWLHLHFQSAGRERREKQNLKLQLWRLLILSGSKGVPCSPRSLQEAETTTEPDTESASGGLASAMSDVASSRWDRGVLSGRKYTWAKDPRTVNAQEVHRPKFWRVCCCQ